MRWGDLFCCQVLKPDGKRERKSERERAREKERDIEKEKQRGKLKTKCVKSIRAYRTLVISHISE